MTKWPHKIYQKAGIAEYIMIDLHSEARAETEAKARAEAEARTEAKAAEVAELLARLREWEGKSNNE